LPCPETWPGPRISSPSRQSDHRCFVHTLQALRPKVRSFLYQKTAGGGNVLFYLATDVIKSEAFSMFHHHDRRIGHINSHQRQ
jgi:hypothetical protein